MRSTPGLALAALFVVTPFTALAQDQMADPGFKPTVAQPAYAGNGPTVVIDQAHHNFHTAGGKYAPFAALLKADGFKVARGKVRFTDSSLNNVRLLVIANANVAGDTPGPTFTEQEADAVERWVANGGSLLLIADHTPFGQAAAGLAKRFGVSMGEGWAFERKGPGKGIMPNIVFSRANGGLGSHPVTEGRSAAERVESVKAFTGQSLVGPPDATILMRFADQAWEAADETQLDAANAALKAAGSEAPDLKGIATPVGGHAQGLALEHGKGRVIVLGEAAMFSAQLIRFPSKEHRPDDRFGMNVATENVQFALNVMHWLARLIP